METRTEFEVSRFGGWCWRLESRRTEVWRRLWLLPRADIFARRCIFQDGKRPYLPNFSTLLYHHPSCCSIAFSILFPLNRDIVAPLLRFECSRSRVNAHNAKTSPLVPFFAWLRDATAVAMFFIAAESVNIVLLHDYQVPSTWHHASLL